MSAILHPMGDGGAERRRWSTCFAVVAAAHALPLLVLAWWLRPMNSSPAPPPAAVMIDMAPEPVAPAARATQKLGDPKEGPIVRPKPPAPMTKPELPTAASTAALSAEAPHPNANETPSRQPAATPVVASPSPAPKAAPARSSSEANPNARPNWQERLLARLEAFKRYPASAQMRAQQGVAYLRFTMNRDGRVLAANIEKSSGYDLLDEEALALVWRAQPLPKPPPEVAGDMIELVAPVEFSLRGR